MLPDQEALVKGVQIHRRINELSSELLSSNDAQERVILSPELYFTLLEYTALMSESTVNRDLLLWELFQRSELFFDTGMFQLRIIVDFFAEPNSISIA
ncbi:MAG: hypothetical protein HUU02_08290 [Bacteroidetes bacterium]|nr:hypothetical protein [Bacteroidota bacterium]